MNLLVIAPHQDDEILSAFLLMHNVLEKNGTVNILYATNGDYRGIDYAYTRYYESLNALSLLGICEDHMLYLGYADAGMSKEKSFLMRLRSTPEQQNSPVSSCTYHPANKETVHSLHTETQAEYTSQNFLDDLVYAIRSCSPSLIAAPSIFDLHGDHYACAMYLYDALRIINHPIKVLSYLIHTENEDVWPNRKSDIFQPPKNLTTFHWIYVYGNKEAVSAKRNAISAFSSQSPSADNCFLYSFAKQNELFLLESIQ